MKQLVFLIAVMVILFPFDDAFAIGGHGKMSQGQSTGIGQRRMQAGCGFQVTGGLSLTG